MRQRLRASCLLFALMIASLGFAVPTRASGLGTELGRNEVRVYSRTLRIGVGDSVIDLALAERLELRDYRRVHRRPEVAGEFFWGFDNFWIFRRPSGSGRRQLRGQLIQLQLERPVGRVTGLLVHWAGERIERRSTIEIDPLLLAESLTEERAPRRSIDLDRLPEHVWQSVLAIEDARFFSHGGVDARSVARAMLKNALAGKVVQGGSTITQQLIKMRDLSPRRTLGRKVSEAVRALALEVEYDKKEILEAYLDAVYLGHVDGVAVHGIGAASVAYFSKSAGQLELAEAALLAGMIQGPNRLQPVRHPERALARQRAVLKRLEELKWIDSAQLRTARRRGLPRLRISVPKPLLDRQILTLLKETVAEAAPKRAREEKGFIVRTTLDPLLQRAAEDAVGAGLARLRARRSRSKRTSLAAALVALDGRNGDILAYVAGDPVRRDDSFDRIRSARRQPGSAVKPFVLLEALETCGSREAVDTSRRVLDAPLSLGSGPRVWAPQNSDDRFRGPVSIRRATIESLNVPFVRVARHCGFQATASRLQKAGLSLPPDPPPSFVLGALEVSPLELVSSYTVFTSLGDRLEPRLVSRLEAPSGRRVHRARPKRRRVSSAAVAFIVRDLLRQTVEQGTAMPARLTGRETVGKTGTSSGMRDAWFVGSTGSVVAAVWVGLDSGEPLGETGSRAAAPIWRGFVEDTGSGPGAQQISRPSSVVEHWIDSETGLRVAGPQSGATRHLFKRGSEPKRRRLWRQTPVAVLD